MGTSARLKEVLRISGTPLSSKKARMIAIYIYIYRERERERERDDVVPWARPPG